MLDDADGRDEKITLTPRVLEPVPMCTVMSDGTLQVPDPHTPLVVLNRTLLSASAILTERTVQRAAGMEQVLGTVQRNFKGWDEETGVAIATVLGQAAAD